MAQLSNDIQYLVAGTSNCLIVTWACNERWHAVRLSRPPNMPSAPCGQMAPEAERPDGSSLALDKILLSASDALAM
eukprot:6199266-Pleurochrysis_carterae.AAC.2